MGVTQLTLDNPYIYQAQSDLPTSATAITQFIESQQGPGAKVGVATAVLESGWEILENSPIVINRYRAATISLDYFGDSIVNSMADVGAWLCGFWIASKLPWRVSVILFVVTELVLLMWVRDSLLLNILQLVYPIEAVKTWQMGT